MATQKISVGGHGLPIHSQDDFPLNEQYVASGGANFGGSGSPAIPFTSIYQVGALGLPVLSSDTVFFNIKTYTVSGGMTASGAATTTRYIVKTWAVTGGITVGGAGVLQKTKGYIASGGLTAG